MKNKIVGGWIKCYMTFQRPETPKWSMAMSIAELIYWKLRAWAPFCSRNFRLQDSEVTAIEVDVAMGYLSGLFKVKV